MQSKQHKQKYTVTNRTEAGASLIEVGVVIGLIIIVSMAGITAFGDELGEFFCDTVANDQSSPGRKGLGFDKSLAWDSDSQTCVSSGGFSGGTGSGGSGSGGSGGTGGSSGGSSGSGGSVL